MKIPFPFHKYEASANYLFGKKLERDSLYILIYIVYYTLICLFTYAFL